MHVVWDSQAFSLYIRLFFLDGFNTSPTFSAVVFGRTTEVEHEGYLKSERTAEILEPQGSVSLCLMSD